LLLRAGNNPAKRLVFLNQRFVLGLEGLDFPPQFGNLRLQIRHVVTGGESLRANKSSKGNANEKCTNECRMEFHGQLVS